MALVIDITDGRGLSNEACRELLLKKSKIMAFLFTENSRLTKKEVCYDGNFDLKLLYTAYITKVLEYKGDLNKIIKFVCVAMCSLVMSLHSRDISINNNNYLLLLYITL